MPEPKFVIDGTEYPVPTRPSLNLDERVIFHEWTGISLEDLDDVPVTDLMLGAFMQMAFMRGNPDVSGVVARKIIGKTNFEEAMAVLIAAAADEDDASPPELPKSEREPSGSPPSSGSSPSTSGVGSTTPSATPGNGHNSGGTLPLVMSVTSAQPTSES